MKFNKLVFEETFPVDGAPNSAFWTHDVGPKWANRELQWYTDSMDNCFIKDGVLTIRAQKGTGECPYSSSRITTYGKKSWQYGRFVISAKLPKGVGSWPAIWMLPNDIKTGVKWPRCGEIDMMEHVGRDPNVVHFSLHTETYNHRKDNHRTYFQRIDGVLDEFHEYEMVWDEQQIAFLVDGIMMVTFKKQSTDMEGEWPFDKPFYLILNLAVGGFWGGPVVDADLPFIMQICSIKVFQ